jgi:hypothetical protein
MQTRLRATISTVLSLTGLATSIGCAAGDSGDGQSSRVVVPATSPPSAPPAGDGNPVTDTPTGEAPSAPIFGEVDAMPEVAPTTPVAPSRCSMEGKPKTTVRATIYDPAGRLPLYNVMVYVPSTPLDPIVEGVTCDRCDATASGRPAASALTDAAGQFVMEDVPDGTNIPFVIQMGKWRRQIALPQVLPCQDNVFDNADAFRLPRNQSEGHLPKIAMVTGRADKLEGMLRVIGVEDSEFTNPDGTGRVNLYTAGFESIGSYVTGELLPPADDLLGSVETLSKYDMVIMSCHGESSAIGYAQPTAQKEAAKAYVDGGGRMFGSHFYFSYLRGPPGSKNHFPTPFPDVATWDSDSSPTTFDIEMGFPKGEAFAQWLVNVGASPVLGSIELEGVEGSAASLLTPYTQSWISAPNTIPYFSMNMPIEKVDTPDEQCGRFVHTGIHVAEGGNGPFPSGNADRELTPQEKAFEFLIFDLSACPARFDLPPVPPKVEVIIR